MILQRIQEYQKKSYIIHLKNKQLYGEVFTPFPIVIQILNRLPEKVWNDPTLTWLDPANGVGHFPMEIFKRLNKGLINWEPEEHKRQKHILHRMLFMVELGENNVLESKSIFGQEANISCSSFFDPLPFSQKTFDIVVGNPPFNRSRDKSTGHTLWQPFVKKILTQTLKPGGYLAFMHPPMWRKPILTKRSTNHGLYDLLCKENQMIYLSIQNKLQGNRDLGCNTRYDWYILQKISPTSLTKINDEKQFIEDHDLTMLTWLPNSNISKIITMLGEPRLPLLYDRNAYKADQQNIPPALRWVTTNQNEVFKYQLIHSTPKKGIQYRYSKVNDRGHFGLPKVIFGEGGIHHCVVDMEGKYGMTHGAMAIQVKNKEEAEKIVKWLMSKEFADILESCCFSAYRIDWGVLSLFKQCKLT